MASAPRGRVLELGSGPGFLAERMLRRCPDLDRYTLLDFSEPMLALSQEPLSTFPAASFIRASFKSEEWPDLVEAPFDCVVTMQAVHELRHKRHARHLYEQIYEVLRVPGLLLACDHLPLDDSQRSAALYMTEEEQIAALCEAGFADVCVALSVKGLVLYAGGRIPRSPTSPSSRASSPPPR